MILCHALSGVSVASLKMPGHASEPPMRPSGDSFQLALNQQQIDKLVDHARRTLGLSPEEIDHLRDFAKESGLIDQVKRQGLATLMLSPEERSSIVVYLNRIAQIPPEKKNRRAVPLAEVLGPMFQLAKKRTDSGRHPVAENRAAFLALSLFCSRVDLSLALGEDAVLVETSKIKPQHVRLSGRHDLVQHFVSSAALALTAGSRDAGRIGLDKELSDARGASGFSFVDLAANRAGIQLALSATASEEAARLFQARLGAAKADSEIMPSIMGLPEGLTEADFVDAYQNTESEGFLKMLRGIDERIVACTVYRSKNHGSP